MRRGVVLAALLAGCSADDGFAVDLTVVAAPSLAAQASSISSLSFAVRGVENIDHTVALGHTFSSERVRYRPKAAGVINFSVAASDSNGAEVGYGEILVQSRAGGSVAATVTLDKPQLTADHASFEFGTVVVGNVGGPAILHVNNVGGGALGPLAAQLEGSDAAAFALSDDSCNAATLQAGDSCAVSIKFVPSATGARAAVVAITVAGAAVRVPVTGTAVPAGVLAFTPATVDCGGVLSGQPALPRDVVLENSGTTPTGVLMLSTSGTDMSEFSLMSDGCSGSALMPGATCRVTVQFSPTTTGQKSAQLNASDGTNFASASLIGSSQVLVTASVTTVGTATGTISAGIGGNIIKCPGTCQAHVDRGGSLSFSATPTPGFSFAGWGGDCAAFGISPTCSIGIDGPKSVSATFTTAVNYIFISSTKITPSALGQPAGTDPLQAADTVCKNLATAAALKGTYVAWMSTTTKGAVSRLGKARGWFRTDGKPFSDMPVPQPWVTYYPPRLDEKGIDLGLAANADGSWVAAASGTGQDGNGIGLIQNCNDWTSSANNANLGVGNAAGGGSGWIYSGSYGSQACDQTFRIYCMGIDYYTPVVVTRQTGRVAFLSKGTFDTSTGIAGADTICKNEAKANGLSDGVTPVFQALLATTTASAASRFADGLTWVRPDGIPVVDKAVDLLNGSAFLVAPIVVSADNTGFDTGTAATGASGVASAGTIGTTCNNWTSKTASFQLTTGYTSTTVTPAYFGGITYFNCDQTFFRVYCLQK